MGALTVTSYFVWRGQEPVTALSITLAATVTALVRHLAFRPHSLRVKSLATWDHFPKVLLPAHTEFQMLAWPHLLNATEPVDTFRVLEQFLHAWYSICIQPG